MRTHGGLAVSTGIAIGPLHRFQRVEYEVVERRVSDRYVEIQRWQNVASRVANQLEEFARKIEVKGGDAEIFEIQCEFLGDPTFGGAICEWIDRHSVNVEAAIMHVTEELQREFESVEDEYFAGRIEDIRDLARRLIDTLAGRGGDRAVQHAEPAVVFAQDLSPSDTITLNLDRTLALCTAVGSATSHTAILSRGLGIPSVVGLGRIDLQDGDMVIVDAVEGKLIVAPDEATLLTYRKRKADFDGRRQRLLAGAKQPATTLDRVHLSVAANVGSTEEARISLEFGAEGVGLLRTEFLFLDRPQLPPEDEQYAVYRRIADLMGKQPVVVRTLDVGGDKQLPSVDLEHEENPFLGIRAIRLGLQRPDRLLLPQLRAILRAGADRRLRIMFPMIGTIGEYRAARALVEQAKNELRADRVAFAADIEVGIMVEIPSVAINAPLFARNVDFFSIGTNDLTQYTLAADRTNSAVAHLADPFDPAVVRLIVTVIDAARAAGKHVAMCGEMAGDPLAVPLLLGAGLEEFSMAAARIPDVKDRIRALSQVECRLTVEKCLSAETASEVRDLCAQAYS